MLSIPDRQYWQTLLEAALEEDMGYPYLDISTSFLFDAPAQANIITRESMVLCGSFWVDACFKALDEHCTIQWHHQDGSHIDANECLVTINGNIKALLSAERTALNGLQTLSATATTTATYVKQIQHTDCKLLDTRKTLPGFRRLQKYAVLCGGGSNHRLGLFDSILIKENHIKAAGSLEALIKQHPIHSPQMPRWIVEVENFSELDQALNLDIPHIMLDNFTLSEMKQAVIHTKHQAKLEVSGNISLDTISIVAETGIDYISCGALTKHIHAIDLSMQVQ